ncbi:MAG: DUF58 domain-containing protein [Myxococcales bacterium]|nr:DUF58 domain-containing protein [Myxococcales bacterium]
MRHLHLKARTLAASILQGEHRSLRVGQAVEFAGYQEYLPGMDLRGLDWRVYGRTDRFVVKRFETETELPCSVVLDLSGDLGTGSAGRVERPDLEHGKASYALVLAATLLYFLHRHGEPVGLEIVAGSGIEHRSLPPRAGRNQLQRLFMQLASAVPGGVADLRPALNRVGSRIRRRSWVAVITDGMEEPSRWLPALAAFARRGADVRLFHLYDRQEWTLGQGGTASSPFAAASDYRTPALFYSPEDGTELAVDPSGAASALSEVVREYVEEVRGGVVRHGGRYLPVPTDLPMDQVIRAAVLDRSLDVEPP